MVVFFIISDIKDLFLYPFQEIKMAKMIVFILLQLIAFHLIMFQDFGLLKTFYAIS